MPEETLPPPPQNITQDNDDEETESDCDCTCDVCELYFFWRNNLEKKVKQNKF